MSTSGGGGKVYLRGDGERMRAACPVLMVRPWWCGGYVGGVAGGAGMVSTTGACAAVCLRRGLALRMTFRRRDRAHLWRDRSTGGGLPCGMLAACPLPLR